MLFNKREKRRYRHSRPRGEHCPAHCRDPKQKHTFPTVPKLVKTELEEPELRGETAENRRIRGSYQRSAGIADIKDEKH